MIGVLAGGAFPRDGRESHPQDLDRHGNAAQPYRLRVRASRMVATVGAASLKHVVVMGVSGCGKSTIAATIATRLGWPFEEGDRFHLPASIESMSAGIPLEDTDRWPWLEKLASLIGEQQAAGRSSVLACPSLKHAYRDILRTGALRVRFLHLHGGRAVLQGVGTRAVRNRTLRSNETGTMP